MEETYLENCVHTTVDIEAMERLMEPENEEVFSLRHILKYSTGGGSNNFPAISHSREKRTILWQAERDGWRVREGRQPCKKVGKMSGMILSIKEYLRKPSPCPERTLKTWLPQQNSSSSRDGESQWISGEDGRRRRVVFEETAKGHTEIPGKQ